MKEIDTHKIKTVSVSSQKWSAYKKRISSWIKDQCKRFCEGGKTHSGVSHKAIGKSSEIFLLKSRKNLRQEKKILLTLPFAKGKQNWIVILTQIKIKN